MCGCTSWKPFAIFDHTYSCWRTFPPCGGKAEASTTYSRTWPARGMTHAGAAYAPATSAHPTNVSECSLLPTPCTSGGNGGRLTSEERRQRGQQVRLGDVLCHPPHTLAYAPTHTTRPTGHRTRSSERLLLTPCASDGTRGISNRNDSYGRLTLPCVAIAMTTDTEVHARPRSRTDGETTNP